MKPRVFIGMSGGVDSSAAAYLLREQGYDVAGCTLLLRDGGEAEAEDARRVCEALKIPHMVLSLREAFQKAVIGDFLAAYTAGRTPNPCIRCNEAIKFGAMLDFALENGFSYIATGHYAAVSRDTETGRYVLSAVPTGKDQSYVLYRLSQAQLSHVLFPLAALTKPEIRAIAEKANLPVAHKPESQDICFIPDGDYAAFLNRCGIPDTPGDFVDCTGRVLGRHRGIFHYTVGQRKGLGIALGVPMYVVALDPKENRVVLGPEGSQYRSTLTVENMNWVSVAAPAAPFRAQVKVRYQAKPAWARLMPNADGTCGVQFDAPQRAPAPGQAAVFYDGARVLGGGVIAPFTV